MACCALGTWLRIDYALFHHHLRHRATSDALQYLERAMELLQRGAVPNLPATIWPPGTSALWAALSAMDPSQQLSAAWNAAASILVMPLTAAAAGLLAGSRAAWIALAIAALHPGFIHYNGFALAEQPFQLAVAIAVYLTLSALVRLESEPEPVRVIARARPRTSDAPAQPVTAVPIASIAPIGGAVDEPAEQATPPEAYIQAEVVTTDEARSGRRGRLGPSSPGGGSAQGKWFGRFSKEPGAPVKPGDEPGGTRKGFLGRAERGAPATASAPAPTPRRSAFADRRLSGPLGRPAGAETRQPTRQAWSGDLDRSRPAGQRLKSEAGPRDPNALKKERKALDSDAASASAQANSASNPHTSGADESSEARLGTDAIAGSNAGFSPGLDAASEARVGTDANTHSDAGFSPGADSSTRPHSSVAAGSNIGSASASAGAAANAGAAASPSATASAPGSAAGTGSEARARAGATGSSTGARDSGGFAGIDDEITDSHPARAPRRTSRFALTGTAQLWIAGAAIGCSWVLASLLRPNALPVAAFSALVLMIAGRSALPSRALGAVLGALLAGALVLTAAAHRCTATAGGRFCLVSNNIAMNVALGQAGTVYGLEFRDPKHPELATAWVPPSLLQHGYQGLGQLPASVYDAPAIFRWVGARFAEDPIAYVVRAIGNGFDLFNLGYWPDEFGRFSERSALVARQAWSAAVFVPALFALFVLARRVLRGRARPAAVFVLGALGGLLLAAALSLGESRYRIPFDGLWIALASAIYAGAPVWADPSFRPAERLGARHFVLWLQALTLCVIVAIGLTHPSLNLGLLVPQRTAALPNRGHSDSALAADFSAPRTAGSAWNAPGNYVWRCSPDCGELRLRLGDRRRARQVSLSVDHNDRYRVLFYRSGQLRAYADVPPAQGSAPGLQTARIDVPEPARTGIDAIGVQPLYGDGGYSLGHLVLVP